MKPARLVFLTLLLLISSGFYSNASHLVGGDFYYKRLSGYSYEITLKLYRDCLTGQVPFDSIIEIGLFDRATDLIVDSFSVRITATYPMLLSMPGSQCAAPPEVCGETGLYIDTVNILPNPGGYYMSYQRCCRNAGIINVRNSTLTGMAFYVEVPDTSIINNSAIFSFEPLPFVCIGQVFELDYSVVDPDGDSVVYSIAEPLAGTLGLPLNTSPIAILENQVAGPYPVIDWAPGYDYTNVFNTNPPLSIHPATGLVTAKLDNFGVFAMAFDVFEYRNGTLISSVHREIEISAVECDNVAPVLDSTTMPFTNVVSIYESDTVCYTLHYSDPDFDDISLTLSGDAFGGTGMVAPFAMVSDVTVLNESDIEFCWRTACGQAREIPYRAVFRVKDDGCPMNFSATDTLLIYIMPQPQAGPVNIQCIGLPDQNTNEIAWIDTTEPGNYLDRYEIYRSDNGGPYMLLATITNDSTERFLDVTAFDNVANEYCYYVQGWNKCGESGGSSDTLCSMGQFNSKKNYIRYVTVNDEKGITLEWEPFPDAPYSIFYIYRAINGNVKKFENIASLPQPVYVKWKDADALTDIYSYCYYIVNSNICNSESFPGNESCSIHLSGSSESMSNKVSWNAYSGWPGAPNYNLYRKDVETSDYRNIQSGDSNLLNAEDHNLPLYHGQFRYYVTALESAGGYNSSSRSNEIILSQEPGLYLPNAFTPNGDNKNDSWGGFETFVKNMRLVIYNRWGMELFSTNNQHAGWDGKYNGREAPQGLYIYEISYSGFESSTPKKVRGTLSLVR